MKLIHISINSLWNSDESRNLNTELMEMPATYLGLSNDAAGLVTLAPRSGQTQLLYVVCISVAAKPIIKFDSDPSNKLRNRLRP